jgi:hypothetical protein
MKVGAVDKVVGLFLFAFRDLLNARGNLSNWACQLAEDRLSHVASWANSFFPLRWDASRCYSRGMPAVVNGRASGSQAVRLLDE